MQPAALPISIHSVTKAYGSLKALDDVSLDIEQGEFFSLLGPSGSGKTTLLMVLAGFVRPDRGSIFFGDHDVIAQPPYKRDLGVVFQNYALFPHMNVRDNVAYPLKMRNVARPEQDRIVDEMLETVQLGGFGSRRVDQLSGGQRQRVALARALSFQPGILLMDEPLSALDKNLREDMQVELRRLHEKLGTTTVYVTHDQREALTLSNRVAVMRNGRIAQLASPRELYEHPNDRFVANFVGQSHFLPVEIRGSDVFLWDRQICVSKLPASGSGPFWLVVRPAKLELAAADADEPKNSFRGTVHDIMFQGDLVTVFVRVSGGLEVSVQQTTGRHALDELPPVDSAVSVRFHSEDVCVVSESGD